jgi:outer membrane protein OmpA-like peptidoglycan-associated protein
MIKTYLILLFCAVGALGPTPVWGSAPEVTTETRPFAVYSGRTPKTNHYVASGYMGDNDLHLSGAYLPAHEGSGSVLRVVYQPKGPKGWSGIYWQNPANNWADRTGKAGWDLSGARRLTFWARGEQGGEKIHEIKVGGITGKYPDSDVATMGPIKLDSVWRQYTVDLNGKDLRHIIGGFCFSMTKYDNMTPVTFYLDDIAFEVPRGSNLPDLETTVVESTPAVIAAEPKLKDSDLQIKSEDDGLRVNLSSQLLFTIGKSDVRPEASRTLKHLIEILKAYPKNSVRVEGHTDSTGNSERNLALSKERAARVKDYLIKQGNFDPVRFTTLGFGQTRPIGDNKTSAGRAQNRRVEILILKNAPPAGSQIEPMPVPPVEGKHE